jgi:hypothetical protein
MQMRKYFIVMHLGGSGDDSRLATTKLACFLTRFVLI